MDKIIMDKIKKGTKFDDGKNRLDLIAPEIIEELGLVYSYGTGKYEDRNWEKGMSWGRIFGAAMRHLWAFWKGEDMDPESGLNHLSHALWNVGALLTYYKREIGEDTR